MKKTFEKKSASSQFLYARLLVSEMALMGHGTFNSSKIYFVLVT